MSGKQIRGDRTRPSAVQKLFTDFDQLLSQASHGELSECRLPTPVHTASDDQDVGLTATKASTSSSRSTRSKAGMDASTGVTSGGSSLQHEMSEAERAFFSSAKSSTRSASTKVTPSRREVVSAGALGEGILMNSEGPSSPALAPSSAPETSTRRSRGVRPLQPTSTTTPVTSELYEMTSSSNVPSPLKDSSLRGRSQDGGDSLHVGWFRSGATTTTAPRSTTTTTASGLPPVGGRYPSRLERLKRLSGAVATTEDELTTTTTTTSILSTPTADDGLRYHTPQKHTSPATALSTPPRPTSTVSEVADSSVVLPPIHPTPNRVHRRQSQPNSRGSTSSAVDDEIANELREIALQTMRERVRGSSKAPHHLESSQLSRSRSRGDSVMSSVSTDGDVSPSRCYRRDVFLSTPDGKSPFPIRDMYSRPDSNGSAIVNCDDNINTTTDLLVVSESRRMSSAGGASVASSSMAAGRLNDASRLDKELALAELGATRLRREEERNQRRQKRAAAAAHQAEEVEETLDSSIQGPNKAISPKGNQGGDPETSCIDAQALERALRPIVGAQEDDREVLEAEQCGEWVALLQDAAVSKEEYTIVEDSRRRTERRRLEAAFSVTQERDAEREHRRTVEYVRDTLVEEERLRLEVLQDEGVSYQGLHGEYQLASRNPLFPLYGEERAGRTLEEVRQWNVRIQLREDCFLEQESIAYSTICVLEQHTWDTSIVAPFASVFGAWDAILDEECKRMDMFEEEEEARNALRPDYVKDLLPIVERDTWKVVVCEAEERLHIEREEPDVWLSLRSTGGVLGVDDGDAENQVFTSSRPMVVWYTRRVRAARTEWEQHIAAKVASTTEAEIKSRIAVSRESREEFILLEELAKRSVDQALRAEQERRAKDVAMAIHKAKELSEVQHQRQAEEDATKANSSKAIEAPPPSSNKRVGRITKDAVPATRGGGPSTRATRSPIPKSN